MNIIIKKLKDAYWEIIKSLPAIIIIAISIFVFRDIPQIYSALMSLSTVAIILVICNLLRQFMLPHFKAGVAIRKAMTNPIGASIVFFAVMLFLSLIVFVTMAKADLMIQRASKWIPVVQENFDKYWGKAPCKYIFPAQIEQESMWKQFATLRTSRELGRGFAQITIAYKSDGTVRFNKYSDAVKTFKELNNWDWENDPYNAKYNLLFALLEDKKNFIIYQKLFNNNLDKWAATLVCYNAGCGTVNNRYAICKKKENCDYTKWFGGLDSVASFSELNAQLYGRNLALERNKYPKIIIFTRSEKYIGLIK